MAEMTSQDILEKIHLMTSRDDLMWYLMEEGLYEGRERLVIGSNLWLEMRLERLLKYPARWTLDLIWSRQRINLVYNAESISHAVVEQAELNKQLRLSQYLGTLEIYE
jgi:hypothetical protein